LKFFLRQDLRLFRKWHGHWLLRLLQCLHLGMSVGRLCLSHYLGLGMCLSSSQLCMSCLLLYHH